MKIRCNRTAAGSEYCHEKADPMPSLSRRTNGPDRARAGRPRHDLRTWTSLALTGLLLGGCASFSEDGG